MQIILNTLVRATLSYVLLFFAYGMVFLALWPEPGVGILSMIIVPAFGAWIIEKHLASKRKERSAALWAHISKDAELLSSEPSVRSGVVVPTSSTAPNNPVPAASTPIEGALPSIIAAKPVGRMAPPSTQRAARWVGKDATAMLCGRDIGGMVYIGSPPPGSRGYGSRSRGFIDPAQNVAMVGADRDGVNMGYWPSYSEIPPVCRATYLDWLASGRRDASYNPGYMFLYFYGLERRFFVDAPPEEERRVILDEVRRLAEVYSENGSAQRYLGQFIQTAEVALDGPAKLQPVFSFSGYELPLGLKVAIGSRLFRGENLSWDWALSWFVCHPEHYLRTPATRCAEEFRALFRHLFDQRFPDGLKVTKPRKMLTATYDAASGDFSAKIPLEFDGAPVPDITGTRKPLGVIQEIVDEATGALEKFSRYLGRKPDGRGSIEAHALLPASLRALFPSKDLQELEVWARDVVRHGGRMAAAEVIGRLEGSIPDKLTRGQLTGAADTLARVGIGLAPDPRNALRAPKVDEPVILFDLGVRIEQLEDVSQTYRDAVLRLAIGAFVAQTDGQVTEAERRALFAEVSDLVDVTEVERRELVANVEWLLSVPPDLPLLRRKLKDISRAMQMDLRAALVAAARADGAVQAQEVAGIEKIYKALGLDPALVYSDIHAGSFVDGPVQVRSAEPPAPGERIAAASGTVGHRLDLSRIAAIRSDTDRVNTVLGSIFASDEVPEEMPDTSGKATLKGLDAVLTALVRELIGETEITTEAFAALCARHGLLPDGALETLNEWAFDTYGDGLLDDYDGIEVSPEIAVRIKTDLEKDPSHVEA